MTHAEAKLRLQCLTRFKIFQECGGDGVTFTNDLDALSVPLEVELTMRMIKREGVQDFPFKLSCTCALGMCSDGEACKCMSEIWGRENPGVGLPYKLSSDGKTKVLKDIVLRGHNAIFECNGGCNCSHTCMTRLVQYGRTLPLAIFRTEDDRGFGQSPHRL